MIDGGNVLGMRVLSVNIIDIPRDKSLEYVICREYFIF